MAPKKKGNRKQEEDWEAELGESAPTTDAPADDQPADGAADEGETEVAGGLMAALRKNKAKKAKKGKPVNDFVDGEDPAADLASKAPEEGTFDEDDVFAGKPKKPIKEVAPPPPAESEDGEFRVKSKKEKEREKKEREKQRKKEQVRLEPTFAFALTIPRVSLTFDSLSRLLQRRRPPLHPRRPRVLSPPSRARRMSPNSPLPQSLRANPRRSSLHTWRLFRSSRKNYVNSVRRRNVSLLKRRLLLRRGHAWRPRKKPSVRKPVSKRRRRSVRRRSSSAERASFSPRPKGRLSCAMRCA